MAPPPPLQPNPSFPLELGFQGLVAVVLTLFGAAVRYVAGPTPARRFVLGSVAWLFASGALAMQGYLTFDQMPPPILLLVLFGLLSTILIAYSSLGGALVEQIPLKWLIAYQVFRLPVELLLHRGHNEGLVPAQMSYFGYNFDVLTGLSALVVGFVYSRGYLPRWGLWLWNACGLALLLNVALIAIFSMPTPWRVFHDEPANVWVTYWPFVWLPTFLVPAALMGHLLVFRRLLQGSPLSSGARRRIREPSVDAR